MDGKIIARNFFRPMNKIIKILTLSDFIITSAFGFVAPILALFITDHIQGGTIETVGFASAFYWLAAILFRLPLANYIDRSKSEKDDFYFMIFGSILISVVPFLFIMSTKIWHVYVIQAIFGLGYTLRVPGWFGMFTRHIDAGQEGYEWSYDTVVSGVGSAATAAIGGILAFRLGFETLFILVGITSVIGSAVLVFLYYIVEPDHGRPLKGLEIDHGKS